MFHRFLLLCITPVFKKKKERKTKKEVRTVLLPPQAIIMKHLRPQRISGGRILQTPLNTGAALQLDQEAQSSRLLHPNWFCVSNSSVLRLFSAALPSRTPNLMPATKQLKVHTASSPEPSDKHIDQH